MGRTGFIHDKLDIKFLILYLMDRVAGPVDFAALAELIQTVRSIADFVKQLVQ